MDVGERRGAARHQGVGSGEEELPVESMLPSFDGATEWLNSPPLAPGGLRGSVVLVQFWTYTCINWLRTLPYVRGWAEKYGDHGLVVIESPWVCWRLPRLVFTRRLTRRDLHSRPPHTPPAAGCRWRCGGAGCCTSRPIAPWPTRPARGFAMGPSCGFFFLLIRRPP